MKTHFFQGTGDDRSNILSNTLDIKLPDIYFLPQWAKLYQERDKGEAVVFEFKHEYGHIYYQFIKREIPIRLSSEIYYDTITPYGFSGPIILDCKLSKKEQLICLYDEEFSKYCLENNIVAEYIRFNPWLKNHLDFNTIYELKYNDVTFYTDLTTNDFFMDEYDQGKRRHIKKSIEKRLKVEFDYTGETIPEFNRIYALGAKRNNISDYYLFDDEFLKKTFKTFKDNQFIINVTYQGKIISSYLVIHYKDYVHGHIGANDPEYFELGGSNVAYYAAALWGVENKKKQLHIGGAHTEGLIKFKRGFTKNGICDFYVGKKIRDIKVYDALVNLKLKQQGIKDTVYFPLYRG